jgi:hypothetical protein
MSQENVEIVRARLRRASQRTAARSNRGSFLRFINTQIRSASGRLT